MPAAKQEKGVTAIEVGGSRMSPSQMGALLSVEPIPDILLDNPSLRKGSTAYLRYSMLYPPLNGEQEMWAERGTPVKILEIKGSTAKISRPDGEWARVSLSSLTDSGVDAAPRRFNPGHEAYAGFVLHANHLGHAITEIPSGTEGVIISEESPGLYRTKFGSLTVLVESRCLSKHGGSKRMARPHIWLCVLDRPISPDKIGGHGSIVATKRFLEASGISILEETFLDSNENLGEVGLALEKKYGKDRVMWATLRGE